jgi:prephenate dehydrogenase
VRAAALMRQAAEARVANPEISQVAAGSFADMTRISAASPELWRDVCLTNREAILASLAQYRRQLDMLEKAVSQNDAAAIEAFFDAAATAKRNWNTL